MTIGKRHALLWGPFFVFIVAFILHVNQMFVMFAALSLLAPVSYMLGRRKLSGVTVARHGKSIMTAGERGNVTLSVRNDGSLRQFFLTVRDALPDGIESPEDGVVMVADLPSGTEQSLTYSLLARRRGVYQVGPPELEAWDYLGLYRFTGRCGDVAELLVYPRAIPMPNLWPRSLRGRTPQQTSRRIIGPSSVYFGPRDYFPGDDIRQIDWKLTAKRDKLTISETEQTEATECVILLDLEAGIHAGHGDASTIEYAATLAASLTAEALARGCQVGLIARGAQDNSVRSSSDPRQQIKILEALARVKADGEQDLQTVLVQHLAELPPGCLVGVISPSHDGSRAGVAARLRALEHPALWFALAAHSFSGDESTRSAYESAVGQLSVQGARVMRIHGDLPLESNLWRRGRSGSGN